MIAPRTELRVLCAGDRWEYDVTGSATRDGRRIATRGTITVTFERRPAGGAERCAIVFAQERRIVGVDGPAGVCPVPDGVFYVVQDPHSLDIAIAGDNMGPGGRDRFAAEPRVFYPGRWTRSTAYHNVLDFGPDGRVENALQTVGVDEVVTPLGPWAAWKTAIHSTSAQFGVVVGHDYWAPELGAPVAFDMIATGPDGSRLESAAMLRATNSARG